jgi:hypothetical protein
MMPITVNGRPALVVSKVEGNVVYLERAKVASIAAAPAPGSMPSPLDLLTIEHAAARAHYGALEAGVGAVLDSCCLIAGRG